MIDREQLARAVLAVRVVMNHQRWSKADLARAAQLNVDTVADTLSGARVPSERTRLALDAAVGWAPGTFTAVAEGAQPPGPKIVDDGGAAKDATARVHWALEGLDGAQAVAVLGQVLLDLAQQD